MALREALLVAGAATVGWLAMTGRLNSPAPERIDPNEALAIINRINADMGNWHDPRDVLAVISIESGFNRNAYRYELHLQDASYGLMQVLSSTARDMGYDGPPEGLFDPETNIRVGMIYLRWVWDFLARRLGRNPTEGEWLSGYNGGVGNVLKGFTAAEYIRRFVAHRDAIAVG